MATLRIHTNIPCLIAKLYNHQFELAFEKFGTQKAIPYAHNENGEFDGRSEVIEFTDLKKGLYEIRLLLPYVNPAKAASDSSVGQGFEMPVVMHKVIALMTSDMIANLNFKAECTIWTTNK